ncbi:hypothetical protein [Microvirga thermotolerans]|uniref:Uncharacterized protein n=1 Tax=Microvirga thermotolerans TaxID=2651334 RepID=A0A5P9JVX5_9HYPH|nr:hypothetical protein [Microvirga thermotolerans]QFU15918.1 hypothetical protein GDR74_06615 [Microvirga thermotolerans]
MAVLFRPSIVPLIDAFRSLEALSDRYDLHILEGPERDLARFMEPAAARAAVSDAMLLAFALGRQRGGPLAHRPLGSRRGSLDEYCILSLIAAAQEPESELAFEAAAALGVVSFDFIFGMAADLLRQIDHGGLALERPSLEEFRAIVGDGGLVDAPSRFELEASFHFHH